jgi:Tfp pilus assembly protein PilN
MRVRLNVATAPARTQRRFVAGSSILGAFAVLGLLYLSWHTYGAWQRERAHHAKMAAVQTQLLQLQDQRRGLEDFFARSDTRQVRDRAEFLNGLIAQRSFPWTKIFMDLEHVLPEGVHVISISPRMVGGRVEVKLVVGALSDESKLKFLRSLEDANEFSRIRLMNEVHPVAQPGDSDRVRLELVVWYVTA